MQSKNKEPNCLNPSCGKKLKHTQGRRPKKYCNESCRNGHYKVLFPTKKKELEKELDEFLTADLREKVRHSLMSIGKVIVCRDADGTERIVDPLSEEARKLVMAEYAVTPESKTSSGLVVEFKPTYDNPEITIVKDELPKTQTEYNDPKTLDELKKRCPVTLKGFEKSEWISTNRQKYNL